MRTAQIRWSSEAGWEKEPDFAAIADLVMVFADHDFFHSDTCFNDLRATFPKAHIVGCSSSGSVCGVEISDGDVVATAIKFEHSNIRLASVDVVEGVSASDAGAHLMHKLKHFMFIGKSITSNTVGL